MKKRFGLLFAALLLLACVLSGCAKGVSVKTDDTTAFWIETAAETSKAAKETGPEKKETKQAEESKKAKETSKEAEKETTEPAESESDVISEDGQYTSKEDVALYLHTYGHLPSNYITKKEAGKLGWQGGDLYKYAKGCSIGGGGFGNNEKLLPAKKGRKYFECDIDYNGGKRGAKRLVYSNDGLIYYTEDHYETFELLYGVE
ncbi:MAG: ribonuclease [Lachnospiraceae bacterium]|nr:ribonuclease [Lachnospiraceae bacterium]